MIFHTRPWIKPQDLNPNGSLLGGTLLARLDEEAAIYAAGQLNNSRLVTKYVSEINFINPVRLGDVIELDVTVNAFGQTSITLGCEVRNKVTAQPALTIDRIVFVNLDESGDPAPHGRQEVTETRMVYRQPPAEPAPRAEHPSGPVFAPPPVVYPPATTAGGRFSAFH